MRAKGKRLAGKIYRRPRVGLALSGGGVRGLAHIGVLKVLEREGIPVDCLAGTSMGGVVAAAYAAGVSLETLEQEALALSQVRHLVRLADPAPGQGGLLEGKRVQDYFERLLNGATFADLSRPLALVAVDLRSGREVILREGSVAAAIRATISLPGLFAPVNQGEARLVDGGVLNNLPVDVARDLGGEVIIAVDVTARTQEATFWQIVGKHRFVPGVLIQWVEVFSEALEIMMEALQEHKLAVAQPDLLLQPAVPAEVSILSGFGRARDVIAAGEAAAEAVLPQLREMIQPRWMVPDPLRSLKMGIGKRTARH